MRLTVSWSVSNVPVASSQPAHTLHILETLSPFSPLLLSAAGCAVHKSCSWKQLSLCSTIHLYELPESQECGTAQHTRGFEFLFLTASPGDFPGAPGLKAPDRQKGYLCTGIWVSDQVFTSGLTHSRSMILSCGIKFYNPELDYKVGIRLLGTGCKGDHSYLAQQQAEVIHI